MGHGKHPPLSPFLLAPLLSVCEFALIFAVYQGKRGFSAVPEAEPSHIASLLPKQSENRTGAYVGTAKISSMENIVTFPPILTRSPAMAQYNVPPRRDA